MLLIDLLLSPLILTADLILLFRREVVLDVEGLTDLLWGFALDHVGNSLAPNVKERLDVKVVGSLGVDVSRRSPLPWLLKTHKDDLEQHLLVHLHELLIPLIDIGGLLSRVGVVVVGSDGVGTVVGAPLNDLVENSLIDLVSWLVSDRDGEERAEDIRSE